MLKIIEEIADSECKRFVIWALNDNSKSCSKYTYKELESFNRYYSNIFLNDANMTASLDGLKMNHTEYHFMCKTSSTPKAVLEKEIRTLNTRARKRVPDLIKQWEQK